MFVWTLNYGWIGQPHRGLSRQFPTRRQAQVFAAAWKAGGKTRSAGKPKLTRVAP